MGILLKRHPSENGSGCFGKGRTPMGRKFKLAVRLAVCLWAVVIVQTVVTRIYVTENGFAQAFARNNMTVERQTVDPADKAVGNRCFKSHLEGKLSADRMQEITDSLFQTMGGGCVMDHVDEDGGYYVAYGYTNGIASSRKVNGHRINLNVTMSYHEITNQTEIMMGTPLINCEF